MIYRTDEGMPIHNGLNYGNAGGPRVIIRLGRYVMYLRYRTGVVSDRFQFEYYRTH